MSDQLIFELPCYPALGSDDFFVSAANILAFEVIQNWSDWTDRRVIITGLKGSGKTHLSNVWANLSGAKFITVRDEEPDLSGEKAIIIEDIDLLASMPNLEKNLLHILNFSRQLDIFVLITSTLASSRLGFHLPDLNSRLQATEHFAINPPDDALLSAVLVKQFNDRQINIPPSLVDFIVKRITRSLFYISKFVHLLDDIMLKSKKGPNRTMICEVLDKIIKDKA